MTCIYLLESKQSFWFKQVFSSIFSIFRLIIFLTLCRQCLCHRQVHRRCRSWWACILGWVIGENQFCVLDLLFGHSVVLTFLLTRTDFFLLRFTPSKPVAILIQVYLFFNKAFLGYVLGCYVSTSSLDCVMRLVVRRYAFCIKLGPQ